VKVGRREFLKLIGSAAASVVVRPDDIEPEVEINGVPVEEVINTGSVDVLEGMPCGPLPLATYAQQMDAQWVATVHDRDDCPLCQNLSGRSWVEPPPVPEPEYDCDFYMAIDQGVCHQSWIDPVTGEARRTAIEWFDHGLHTIFRANSQYLGEALSAEVDPFTYAHSIWAAGLAALWQMVTDEGKRWPPVT
jgi:hypothetical protein